MGKDTGRRSGEATEIGLTLEQLIRRGARQLIQSAIEAEVQELLNEYSNVCTLSGTTAVVRNGYLPQREILTAVGPVEVRVPKVRDRSGTGVKFNSALVPPYVRRSKTIAAALPWLYLKGVSSGDMREALAVLVGEEARGLSPNVIGRLKAQWAGEHADWMKRDLTGCRYLYWWVDGIHTSVREEDGARSCLLVIIGVTAEGKKELVSIGEGLRESAASWLEVLRDLKARGLDPGPLLAVGDGALGFWAALDQIYPKTKVQRCWVHKSANVLNELPKSVQGKAKAALHEIWMAPTRAQAIKAFDAFLKNYQARPTPSNRPSPPCVSAPRAPRTACRARPSSVWRSNSCRKRRSAGGASAASSALPNCLQAWSSRTAFRSPTTRRNGSGWPPDRLMPIESHTPDLTIAPT